jgi:hypothetical protein
VPRLENGEFAFERRDPSRSLPSEAADLCNRGLALLNEPTERVGEISGGNLPKFGSSRHSNLLERRLAGEALTGNVAGVNAQPYTCGCRTVCSISRFDYVRNDHGA